MRRSESVENPDGFAACVSTYIAKNDPTFYANQPMIHVVEMLLRNADMDAWTSVRMPTVRVLLEKHRNGTNRNICDQTITLHALVKRFVKIDLRHVQQEAGSAEPLTFDNRILSAKHGTPERIGYLFYVRQCRSAFAVFAFAIEQLQQYAQISRTQIMYACSQVTAIAMDQPPNAELVSHCMAFMEMVGVNTSALRALLRCVRLWRHRCDSSGQPRRSYDDLTDAERLQVLIDVQLAARSSAGDVRYDADDLDALRLVCEASIRWPACWTFCRRAANRRT